MTLVSSYVQGCSRYSPLKITAPANLRFDLEEEYARDSSIVKRTPFSYAVVCRWVVTVRRGFMVYLRFKSLTSSNYYPCEPRDLSLYIYDSPHDKNIKHMKWRCNMEGKLTFLSSGRNMYIRYRWMYFKERDMGKFELTAELKAVSINNTSE